MAFTAQYGGGCALCPAPIKPGDLVQYGPTEELEHVKCPPDADACALRAPLCDRCKANHPGEC